MVEALLSRSDAVLLVEEARERDLRDEGALGATRAGVGPGRVGPVEAGGYREDGRDTMYTWCCYSICTYMYAPGVTLKSHNLYRSIGTEE